MARDRTQGAVLGAFVASRLVVWVAGIGAIAAFGLHDHNAATFDDGDRTRPFGAFGDALAGPGSYWDSKWYLRIADEGYTDERAAFFPLFPLLVRIAGAVVGSPVAGGILVSLACFAGALVLLHRLVALDFGDRAAGLCVALVALFPAAVFFSAVYSEALFLLLSVGAVYAARTGRWEVAGLAGALATGTRSAGIVLLVALALVWWRAWRAGEARRRDAAWLAAVPLGLILFCAYLGASGLDALGPFRAQEAWSRELSVPFLGGIVEGARSAGWGIEQIVTGAPRPWPVYDPAWMNVGLFACLVAALVALVGAFRRLPLAYAAYALAALALPLTFPVESDPLMSLPRFVSVLWPLHLWLALWLLDRGRPAVRVALGAFAVGLALVSAEVSTWGWIA